MLICLPVVCLCVSDFNSETLGDKHKGMCHETRRQMKTFTLLRWFPCKHIPQESKFELKTHSVLHLQGWPVEQSEVKVIDFWSDFRYSASHHLSVKEPAKVSAKMWRSFQKCQWFQTNSHWNALDLCFSTCFHNCFSVLPRRHVSNELNVFNGTRAARHYEQICIWCSCCLKNGIVHVLLSQLLFSPISPDG